MDLTGRKFVHNDTALAQIVEQGRKIEFHRVVLGKPIWFVIADMNSRN